MNYQNNGTISTEELQKLKEKPHCQFPLKKVDDDQPVCDDCGHPSFIMGDGLCGPCLRERTGV